LSNPLTIRKLIERVCSGDIRIPAFQRDFVWEHDQVAFLIDSIYKGFPIGTIFLWKTENRLSFEKKLGQFTLPEPTRDYPVNYVLDGQQRITSIFTVFQHELPVTDDTWVDIYFDMEANESLQESCFSALEESEIYEGRHFPVKNLFDPVLYRKSTDNLTDEQITLIDELQTRFKEYIISNEVFESDDRSAVALVFERINRAGTELNKFDLLSAWSWSEDFHLKQKFANFEDEFESYGYSKLSKDKDLQLKVCSAIISGETTPAAIFNLSGDEVRTRFDEIESGIKGAIDYLRKELLVYSFDMLPYPGLLVPLTTFFATNKTDGHKYNDIQREKLSQWFWISVLSKRYSSDVNNRQRKDIIDLLKLQVNENHVLQVSPRTLRISFAFDKFTKSINTKALILLLAKNNPISMISGTIVNLDKVLKSVNKNEFHHIFPKKYLEGKGHSDDKINVLSNFCFLSKGDNIKILAKAPDEYIELISKERREEILSKSFIPVNFHKLTYDEFLFARTKLLNTEAKRLMGITS
jgi:hypothetical protein